MRPKELPANLTLAGVGRAIEAVIAALRDVDPLPNRISWTLVERGDGQVEIRERGRCTVAKSWLVCVRNHLAPAVGGIRVGPL